jgi:dihydrofolate reductase
MIQLVVARARNGVIGRDGRLPWHLPADLARFKRLTLGTAMIMGRKTFESLPACCPSAAIS